MPDSSISLAIKTRNYRRPFAKSLQTAHGTWSVRHGMLVCLENESGKSGFGEIAPLPEFGSETIVEASRFIRVVGNIQTRRRLEECLAQAPPATAFGLWSALRDLDKHKEASCQSLKTSGLMALDSGWEQALANARSNGMKSFKIKVGLGNQETERSQLSEILQNLMQDETVRLDPNMSWDQKNLSDWSSWLANITDKVQYIEEPLQLDLADVQKLNRMASISPVPLALDESLSIHGLVPWLESGWPGYWIIKPAILGIPDWLHLLNPAKVVLSSAFETGIGMQAILSIAQPYARTCHGLGTGMYFDDGLSPVPMGGSIRHPTEQEVVEIWSRFSQS